MTAVSSLDVMVPEASLSKSVKASWYSERFSSDCSEVVEVWIGSESG